MQANPKLRQKSRSFALLTAMTLFAVLAITVQGHSQKITAINVPVAGTGAGQGTLAFGVNGSGEIVGYYYDANNVSHSFLRKPNGTFKEFDPAGSTGTLWITASCSIPTAASLRLTLWARAQAPIKALFPKATTRRG